MMVVSPLKHNLTVAVLETLNYKCDSILDFIHPLYSVDHNRPVFIANYKSISVYFRVVFPLKSPPLTCRKLKLYALCEVIETFTIHSPSFTADNHHHRTEPKHILFAYPWNVRRPSNILPNKLIRY